MPRYIDNNGGAAWLEICPIKAGLFPPPHFMLDIYNGVANTDLDTYLPNIYRLPDTIQETILWEFAQTRVDGGIHYILSVACVIGKIDPTLNDIIDQVSRLGAVLRLKTLNNQILYMGTHTNPMFFTPNGKGGEKITDLNGYRIAFEGGGMFAPYFKAIP